MDEDREAVTTHQAVQEELHNQEVEDILQSHESEVFVDDDSDSEPAKEDKDLDNLMGTIFGEGFNGGESDSDNYDTE